MKQNLITAKTSGVQAIKGFSQSYRAELLQAGGARGERPSKCSTVELLCGERKQEVHRKCKREGGESQSGDSGLSKHRAESAQDCTCIFTLERDSLEEMVGRCRLRQQVAGTANPPPCRGARSAGGHACGPHTTRKGLKQEHPHYEGQR